MKPKFLIGLVPLIATVAFVAVPAAAQAAPCFQTKAKGPCITKKTSVKGKLVTKTNSVLTDTTTGLTVESESFEFTLVQETKGKSTIEKVVFDGNKINLPAPCAATPEQLSNWTDQLKGTEAAGYTDAITVGKGEGEIVVSGCTGVYEPYNGTYPFEGTVEGAIKNGSPATITFKEAPGIKLDEQPTLFSAEFEAPIFVSEEA